VQAGACGLADVWMDKVSNELLAIDLGCTLCYHFILICMLKQQNSANM
jgi:hypothetical protein